MNGGGSDDEATDDEAAEYVDGAAEEELGTKFAVLRLGQKSKDETAHHHDRKAVENERGTGADQLRVRKRELESDERDYCSQKPAEQARVEAATHDFFLSKKGGERRHQIFIQCRPSG